MVAAVVLPLLAGQEHEVKPLDLNSLLLTLGVIVLVAGAIILAGLGYFTPDGNGD